MVPVIASDTSGFHAFRSGPTRTANDDGPRLIPIVTHAQRQASHALTPRARRNLGGERDVAPAGRMAAHFNGAPVQARAVETERFEGGLFRGDANREPLGCGAPARGPAVAALASGEHTADIPMAKSFNRRRDFRHVNEVDTYPERSAREYFFATLHD